MKEFKIQLEGIWAVAVFATFVWGALDIIWTMGKLTYSLLL